MQSVVWHMQMYVCMFLSDFVYAPCITSYYLQSFLVGTIGWFEMLHLFCICYVASIVPSFTSPLLTEEKRTTKQNKTHQINWHGYQLSITALEEVLTVDDQSDESTNFLLCQRRS